MERDLSEIGKHAEGLVQHQFPLSWPDQTPRVAILQGPLGGDLRLTEPSVMNAWKEEMVKKRNEVWIVAPAQVKG